MKFEEALKALREGKKVRVTTWDKSSFVKIDNGNCISTHDGFPIYNFYMDDILESDWKIVEDKPKFTREQIEYIKNMMDLCLDWYPLGLVKMPIIFAGTFKMKLDSLCE